MASIRKLSDVDVKTIFSCVHQNILPPKSLEFRIVPVGSNGLKLSPPSYKFEDGLYILLKPQKKLKGHLKPTSSKVPSNLTHLIMHNLPEPGCTWSLSGPQFPKPTRVQQRYCYPKGEAEYSNHRGGALWTMYYHNGLEDLEYRLLHVYFSSKRAVNQGGRVSAEKKAKKQKNIKIEQECSLDHNFTDCSMSTSSFDPTLSFSPLPFCFPSLSSKGEDIVTPDSRYASASFDLSKTQSPTQFLNNEFEPLLVNDLKNEEQKGISENMHDSEPFSPSKIPSESNDSAQQISSTSNEIHPALIEFKTCWLDSPDKNIQNDDDSINTQELRFKSFSKNLMVIHSKVREKVMELPESEQGCILNILSSWAKNIAQDPLNVDFQVTGEEKQMSI